MIFSLYFFITVEEGSKRSATPLLGGMGTGCSDRNGAVMDFNRDFAPIDGELLAQTLELWGFLGTFSKLLKVGIVLYWVQ